MFLPRNDAFAEAGWRTGREATCSSSDTMLANRRHDNGADFG